MMSMVRGQGYVRLAAQQSDSSDSRQNTRSRSRPIVARVARMLLLALVGGALLMVAFTARQATQGDVSAALACGLGNPQTMLANKIPALLYPVTPDMPQNAPQGVFPLDYAVNSSIPFTEDLSRVPGAPKLSSFKWKWNFGDGTSDVFTQSPSHTFTKTGTFYVGSWIWDTTTGQWDSFDSAQIHIISTIVTNQPVAKADSNMAVTAIGQSVTFDAAGSHASDGSQLKYLWNFNDGTNAPTASLAASDLEVDTGSTVNFDAGQSAPPQGVDGDAIAKYVWSFGDGSASQTTETPTTSHTYQKAGSYKVTLTVYDKPGAQATTTLTVRVLGAAGGGVSPL